MKATGLVLKFIAEHGGKCEMAQLRQIPRNYNRVRQAVTDLIESGSIERVLVITPNGQQELDRLLEQDGLYAEAREKRQRRKEKKAALEKAMSTEQVEVSRFYPVLTDAEIERIRDEALASRAVFPTE